MEIKNLPFKFTELKLAGDGASFMGYASAFNKVDSYGDTILKGAYVDTLRQNGLPKMFFNHNSYDVPIGKWTDAKEDDYGLLLTGEFTPGNVMGEQVRAALKHETVDSLSIGYSLMKGDFDETTGGRIIRKVARLKETSIVTFPADEFAKIDPASVKSAQAQIEEIKTIRDFEYFLRDAGSLSKGVAQALTARAKVIFTVRDAGDAAEVKAFGDSLVERLERLVR